jgi:hypothetical protein
MQTVSSLHNKGFNLGIIGVQVVLTNLIMLERTGLFNFLLRPD